MSDASKTQLSLRDIVDLEAWLDESFKAEVLQDPAGAVAKVAEKYGVELPGGVEYRVVSDTDTQYNIVLSTNPAGDMPASEASEVRAYGMEMISNPSRPDEAKRGSSYTIFCNPAICKAVSQYPQR